MKPVLASTTQRICSTTLSHADYQVKCLVGVNDSGSKLALSPPFSLSFFQISVLGVTMGMAASLPLQNSPTSVLA